MASADHLMRWARELAETRRPESAAIERLAVAFEESRRGNVAAVDTLVAAIRDSRGLLYDLSYKLLACLAREAEVGRIAIADLAESKRARDRWSALVCVSVGGFEGGDAIVRALARDKSVRVRRKAADAALLARARSTVNALRRARREEADPEAQRAQDLAIALLTDGYLVRNDQHGASLIVLAPEGILSRPITADELRSPGAAALAQRVLRDP
jgi:hypothetical protein